MTTKQAKRYFHWHARVTCRGRWQITYCNKTLDARTGARLLEVFLQRHAEFLEQNESRCYVNADIRQTINAGAGYFRVDPYTKEEMESTPISCACNLVAAPVAKHIERVFRDHVSVPGVTIGPNAGRLIAEALKKQAAFTPVPPAFGGAK